MLRKVCKASSEKRRRLTLKSASPSGRYAGYSGTNPGLVRSGLPPTALRRFAASVRCSISSTAVTRSTWYASAFVPGRMEYSAVR
jgi:hypothetical protein